MPKCEVQRCRNEMDMIRCGKKLCWGCWKKFCDEKLELK